MTDSVKVTLYNDAGCPSGLLGAPGLSRTRMALRAAARLAAGADRTDWSMHSSTSIGATRHSSRPRGMPGGSGDSGCRLRQSPGARVVGTGRACRAVVASRLREPGSEWAVFRSLQFAWFTTTLLLDENDGIAEALRRMPGIDVGAVIASIDTPEVEEAYQRDRAEDGAPSVHRPSFRVRRPPLTVPPASPRLPSSSSSPAGDSRPAAGRTSRPTMSSSRISSRTGSVAVCRTTRSPARALPGWPDNARGHAVADARQRCSRSYRGGGGDVETRGDRVGDAHPARRRFALGAGVGARAHSTGRSARAAAPLRWERAIAIAARSANAWTSR